MVGMKYSMRRWEAYLSRNFLPYPLPLPWLPFSLLGLYRILTTLFLLPSSSKQTPRIWLISSSWLIHGFPQSNPLYSSDTPPPPQHILYQIGFHGFLSSYWNNCFPPNYVGLYRKRFFYRNGNEYEKNFFQTQTLLSISKPSQYLLNFRNLFIFISFIFEKSKSVK